MLSVSYPKPVVCATQDLCGRSAAKIALFASSYGSRVSGRPGGEGKHRRGISSGAAMELAATRCAALDGGDGDGPVVSIVGEVSR